MTEQTPSRLVPDKEFPEYAYVPGQKPHPRNDEGGHSRGEPEPDPNPLDPEQWERSNTYLYGLDLFNYGYYWEAHEQWEALWLCAEDGDLTERFLQGLIKITAAGVKVRQENQKGVRNHAGSALEIFESLREEVEEKRFCGLSIEEVISFVEGIRENTKDLEGDPEKERERVFEEVLIPVAQQETDYNHKSPEENEGISGTQKTINSTGTDEDSDEDAQNRTFPEEIKEQFQDRYHIRRELGKGGMGQVLEAEDPDIPRNVAIKTLRTDRELSKSDLVRFVEEAQIQGQLDHPNIPPVHEIDRVEEGQVFFSMQEVRGETLEEILEIIRQGKNEYVEEYTLTRLLEIFTKVCDAIGFAHSRGVIHRDLKPENVMIGSFGEVLVMDWGLAKILSNEEETKTEENRGVRIDTATNKTIEEVREQFEEGATIQGNETLEADQEQLETDASEEERTKETEVLAGYTKIQELVPGEVKANQVLSRAGTVMGTPAYMSPEQARGDVESMDEQTDIFELGGILYKILCLRPPYTDPEIEEFPDRAMDGDIVPPSERESDREVPPDLESVAMKCLSKEKEDRYGSVDTLRSEVTAFLENRTVTAADYTILDLFRKWYERNKTMAMTGMAAAIIILVLAGFSYYRIDQERQQAIVQKKRAKKARKVAEKRRVEAENARKKVKKEKKHAEKARAEGLITEGNAWMKATQFGRAQNSYQEAIDQFQNYRTTKFLGNLGMWHSFQRAPRPVIQNLLDTADINGNIKTVTGVPDKPEVAVGTDSGEVLFIDRRIGRVVRRVQFPGKGISSLLFVNGGNALVAGGNEGRLHRLNLRNSNVEKTIKPFNSNVFFLLRSPRRSCIFTGAKQSGEILCLDVDSLQKVERWNTEVDNLNSARLGSKQQSLFLWGEDAKDVIDRKLNRVHQLQEYDLKTRRKTNEFPLGKYRIFGIAVHPDSNELLASTRQYGFRIWNANTGEYRKDVEGIHENDPRGIKPVPEPGSVLTMDSSGIMKLWNVNNEEIHQTFNGTKIKGRDHAKIPDRVSISSNQTLFSSMNQQVLRKWDLDATQGSSTLGEHAQRVQAGGFSRDGSICATAGGFQFQLWSVPDRKRITIQPRPHYGKIYDLEFSPDGSWLATAAGDQTTQIWDVSSGQLTRLHTLEADSDLRSLAFGEEGNRLMAVSEDRTLKQWDVQSGTVTDSITFERRRGGDKLQLIKKAPDQRTIALGFSEDVVMLFDPVRWEQRKVFLKKGKVHDLEFTPEGKYLIGLIGPRIWVWNVKSGDRIFNQRVPSDAREIESLSFPAGTYKKRELQYPWLYVTGGTDGKLYLYDVETGDILKEIELDMIATFLERSPTSNQLLVGGEKGHTRILDFQFPSRIRTMEKAFNKARQTLARQPSSEAALRTAGDWYGEFRLWEEAKYFYEKAIENGATVPARKLGRVYWGTGNHRKARDFFQQSLNKNEGNSKLQKLIIHSLQSKQE